MGQGPSRGGHYGSDDSDRQDDADTEAAQERADEAIRRVVEELEEQDRIDEGDVGRIAGGASGGFAGGALGGPIGSALGAAIGREAGGRAGDYYIARRTDGGPSSIEEIGGVGEGKVDALREAGYESLEDVQDASQEELEAVEGIGSTTAERLVSAAGTSTGENEAGGVSESVRESVDRVRFQPTEEGMFDEQRQAFREASAEAREVYRAGALGLASRTRSTEVAQAMADHVDEGRMNPYTRPHFSATAGDSEATTTTLTLSGHADTDEVYHEMGHVMTDAYGYSRGEAGDEASNEYMDRQDQGERDPFVESDPDDPEYLMSQEYGEEVENVPEEVETVVDEANQSWQRIQRAYREGGRRAARGLRVKDNYSATNASELLSNVNEMMQGSTPRLEREDYRRLERHDQLVAAYQKVFTPGEKAKRLLSEGILNTDDEG